MAKIKKIRKVEPRIKNIREVEERRESDLEEEIQEESSANFASFISGTRRSIPILDSEQPQEIEGQPLRLTAAESTDSEGTRQLYQESGASGYIPSSAGSSQYTIAESAAQRISTGLARRDISQAEQAGSDFLDEKALSPSEQRQEKYQSGLESQKGKDKNRYAWE